jgi:hypothetical protein
MKAICNFRVVRVFRGVTFGLSILVLTPAFVAADSYSSNLVIIQQSQDEALEQARQMLKDNQGVSNRSALEAAVKEMEHSKASLAQAPSVPEKLNEALAAQEAAYQALLKLLPREYRVSRTRNAGGSGGANQPNPRQLNQLEMTEEENRYETERQATAAPTPQQRARGHAADQLKQLAQRQQDLNERLRELQTALQEARTDQQREEIKRELKRLQEQERQMLADLDQLRQDLAKAPDSSDLAQTRQQLEQTRSDVQRAAEALGKDSPSQALAAGARAQESMRQLREQLRKTSSSQFSEQMRQLRRQVRDMSGREDDLARGIESLGNSDHKSLDDSAERKELSRQALRQQSALTNLLSGLRAVSEQAESTEPLLSRQLYDTLRRADQARPESQLDATAQLLDRGFMPQAAQAEKSVRQSVNQLRQGVERAAESVLGSESDALKYAQRELEDLSRQVERDAASTNTNSAATAESGRGRNPASSQSGRSPGSQPSQQPGSNGQNQNPNSPGNSGSENQETQSSSSGAASGAGESGNNPDLSRLRELVQELGGASGANAGGNNPITGVGYANWADRMREVEQVLDSPDLRNQLATVRERVGAFRGYYRQDGRVPSGEVVRNQILEPMAQARVWLRQQIARLEDANSLVPLDRDPVPEKYSDLVRSYYEKLGSGERSNSVAPLNNEGRAQRGPTTSPATQPSAP